MEVIAIEGPLTDYEVKELINSALYAELTTEAQDQAIRRDLLKKKFQLQKDLGQAENRLTKLQTALTVGKISDETFRSHSASALQKNQPTLREFSTICATMRWRNRIESLIWMKQRLLQHFSTNAVFSQDAEHVETFLTSVQLWQSKWHVSLTPSELITLLNLRPLSNAFYEQIINGWYDRVVHEAARDELVAIVSALPEGPNIYFDQEMSDDSKTSQDEKDRKQQEAFQALLEADQNKEIEGEITANQDFDTSRGAQFDQDDDGVRDDDE